MAYWFTYGARIAAVGATFLIGLVAARALGPVGRGTYAFAATAAGTVTQILNAGLSSAFLYFVSRRHKRAGEFLVLTWIITGSGLAITSMACWFFSFSVQTPSPTTLVLLWAPIQLGLLLQEQLILGALALWKYNTFQITGRTLGLVAALCSLQLFPRAIMPFLIALVMADATTLLLGSVVLLRSSPVLALPRWKSFKPVIRLAGRAFPVLLLPFLLVRSDILLMRLLRSSAETGVYAVAAQLIDGWLLLPSAMAAVLFVSFPSAHDMVPAAIEAVRRLLVVSALAAVGIIFGGRGGIATVFGEGFSESFWPTVVLFPGAVALGVQSIVSQYFARRGYPVFLTAIWAVGYVLNLAINAFAIPKWGAVGAALASTVSYCVISGLVLWQFLRESGTSAANLWQLVRSA